MSLRCQPKENENKPVANRTVNEGSHGLPLAGSTVQRCLDGYDAGAAFARRPSLVQAVPFQQQLL